MSGQLSHDGLASVSGLIAVLTLHVVCNEATKYTQQFNSLYLMVTLGACG